MKKTLIIFAIVFLLGAVIFTVGFGGLGFDYKNLNTDSDLIERTYKAEYGVESIIADCGNCDVFIEEIPEGQILITYTESEKDFYEITKSGNILKIDSKTSKVWSDYLFNISLKPRKITLSIPHGYKGDINIETDNGNIVYNLTSADDVTLITDNKDITAANAEITGSLKMSTKNGALFASNVKASLSAVFSNKNGSIILEGITADSISADNNNGSIVLKNSSSETAINLITDNKNIEIDNIYFGAALECLNKNGSIRGSIVGKFNEFSFNCLTKNGDNNLPESVFTGDRLITAKTDNGDIDISFMEKPETDTNEINVNP